MNTPNIRWYFSHVATILNDNKAMFKIRFSSRVYDANEISVHMKQVVDVDGAIYNVCFYWAHSN